ncbi:MAG: DUF2760 domain-containing protein [Desulfobacterales bacterium]|nr:DUF2760 domain-containing protein [Desulfobacterales bacterium]
MKKTVAILFLILMLIMSALAGGAYLAAKLYIDPTLEHLNDVVADMEPRAGRDVTSHLVQLQEIREMGNIYVPVIFFVTGITATLVLSLLLRGTVKQGSMIHEQRPRRGEEKAQIKREEAEKTAKVDAEESGACRILSLLQNKGRLIDFFQEDITPYSDTQIGSAIRYIHEDCKNALDEYITFAPVMKEKEEQKVVISEGFDPSEIRLTGNITGEPPFEGSLQHSGWKITKIRLPSLPKGQTHTVIAPAEVEVGQIEGR